MQGSIESGSRPSATDQMVEIRGNALAVRRLTPSAVPPDASTLVFLHEGLGCIDSWKGFPAAVVASTGLPGLVYDRQGYGRSGPMTDAWDFDYLHRGALEELPAVLAACSVERPVLIGHSDGGTIALLYAAHHPTAALITEAAHIFVEESARDGIRRTIEAWRTGDLEAKLERYHGDKTRRVFWSWADTWLAPWFESWNIGDELTRIRCPALLLQGAQDQYATRQHLAEIEARVGGEASSRLIPDCGHAPHHEAAETTLRLMTDFLVDTASSAGGPLSRDIKEPGA